MPAHHRELLAAYSKHEINVGDRWSEGVAHHAASLDLMEHIKALDFEYQDDHFCWKTGGDGDNGEMFMYLLDMYFELQDSLRLTSNPDKT